MKVKQSVVLAAVLFAAINMFWSFAAVPGAEAAREFYLLATGSTTGPMTNRCGATAKGYENTCIATTYANSIGVPAGSGKPSYGPVQVSMPLNKSYPLFLTVLANNENLTNVTIRFATPNAVGVLSDYQTTTLLNAKVIDVKRWTTDVSATPDMYTVTFDYTTMTVNMPTEGTSFTGGPAVP